MEEPTDHRDTIQELHLYFTTHVDLIHSNLWSALVQEKIISQEQYASILDVCKTRYQQVSGLLDHLRTQTREVFDRFVACLKRHDHRDVARKIRDTEKMKQKGTRDRERHAQQRTLEQVTKPYIVFMAEYTHENEPGPVTILRSMKQNLDSFDSSIGTRIMNVRTPMMDPPPTHVVKLFPGQHKDINASSSCVIFSSPEDYYKGRNGPAEAVRGRDSHLSVSKSKANLFLGKSVHDRWKKYLEMGDKNTIYYPSYVFPDSNIYQSPLQGPWGIVVQLDSVLPHASRTLNIVLTAIPSAFKNSELTIHVLFENEGKFKTDIVKILKEYPMTLDLIDLKDISQAKQIMENTIWIFAGCDQALSWLKMIPVSHGIPHIISVFTDLHVVYSELPESITSPFIVRDFSVSELSRKLEWLLTHKKKAYDTAAKLSDQFCKSQKVIEGHLDFMRSCLGDYLATVTVHGSGHNDTLVSQLNKMVASASMRRGMSTDQGKMSKLLRSLRKSFERLISVRRSSIAFEIYVNGDEALKTLEQNIKNGKAARTLRGVFHQLCISLGITDMPLTYLHLILEAPKVFRDRASAFVEKATHFKEEYQVQGEKLIAAARNLNKELVEQLIKDGVDVNYQNKVDRNALMESVAQGNIAMPIVRTLIDAGALIHESDQEGRTALIEASACGAWGVEIVRLLVRNGALEHLVSEQTRSSKIQEQIEAVIDYLDGDESRGSWEMFVDSLRRYDHKEIAENLQKYIPEAFSAVSLGVPLKSTPRYFDQAVEPDFPDLEGLELKGVFDDSTHKKYTAFFPGQVVFEGSKKENSILHFPPYNGPCEEHHKGLKLAEPKLLHPETFTSEAESFRLESVRFRDHFRELLDEVLSRHNDQIHGELQISGRFGKLYIFGDPPEKEMTIKRFNQLQRKPRRKKSSGRLHSTFTPAAISHEDLKPYLIRKGFELHEIDKRYIVSIRLDRHKYRVALDWNLHFIELRHQSTKQLAITLKRAQESHRDIRLDVTSARLMPADSPQVAVMKRAQVIDVIDEKIVVRPEFMDKCQFIRRKVTETYRQKKGSGDSFENEVLLIKTQNKDLTTREQLSVSEGWRDEVIVRPVQSDLTNQDFLKAFPRKLLTFCKELEQAFWLPY